MKRKVASLLLLLLAIAYAGLSQSFVHPGIFNTQDDFNHMAGKVSQGAQPWKGSYDLLVASPEAQLGWAPRATDTIRRGGTGDNVALLYRDVAAAYQHALIWKITGKTAHGNKAVEILNAWSDRHKVLTGNADRYLASGIFGYQFANAAEMMRGYPGFELERFKNYLLNVFYYPLIERFLLGNQHGQDHNGACITNYRANWDLCNLAAMIAIGVLCDNREIYNKAITYFKTGGGNGSIFKAANFVHSSTLAQWEESGRDQAHTQGGLSHMAYVCQIAWLQGDDLFSYDDSRFRKAAEYIASYNNGNDVPYTELCYRRGTTCSWACESVISSTQRGNLHNIWEMIYDHYANRVGQATLIPNVAALAARQRPARGPSVSIHPSTYDYPGFGSLTHHSIGRSCNPTNVSPYLRVNGGSWQQTNSATVTEGSSVQFGPQAGGAGSWSWTGCGTAGTAREQTVTVSGPCTAVATYTNSCGTQRTQAFNVAVNGRSGSGPIAHYAFDQNAIDVSGNGKDATLNGGSYVSGHFGSAVHLDGVDDYVALPQNVVSTLSSMTISTWVYLLAAPTWPRIFDIGNYTNRYMYLTSKAGSGKLRFAITTSGNLAEQGIEGGTALETGTWKHVAVTLSGTTGRLYVDGVAVGTNTAMTLKPSDLGTTITSYIGRSQYADPYFSGYIDDFRIFNRELTASEISGIFSGGPIPDGTYKIFARHSGKVLEVANNGTANGTNVRQWPSNDCACQQWTLTHQGNGEYTIAGVGSGKNLDVSGVSTADGANIHIWQSTGAANQRFTFSPTDNGYHRITAVHSGKVVDVQNISTADGANVHQWRYLGAANQQWRMDRVETVGAATIGGTEEQGQPELNAVVSGKVTVYPNPVSGRVTIKVSDEYSESFLVYLRNTLGNLVMTKEVYGQEHVLDLSTIPQGVYFLTLMNEHRRVVTKIVKE